MTTGYTQCWGSLLKGSDSVFGCSSNGMDAKMEVINVYCLLSFGHWLAVIHVHEIFYPLFAMQSLHYKETKCQKRLEYW